MSPNREARLPRRNKKAPFLLLLLAPRGARLQSANVLSGPRGLTVNDLPQKEPAGRGARRTRANPGARTHWPSRAPPAAQAPPPVFRDPARLGVPGAGDRGAPMEATSPAASAGPQPHAQGAASESASLLRRIKGKLFTW